MLTLNINPICHLQVACGLAKRAADDTDTVHTICAGETSGYSDPVGQVRFNARVAVSLTRAAIDLLVASGWTPEQASSIVASEIVSTLYLHRGERATREREKREWESYLQRRKAAA